MEVNEDVISSVCRAMPTVELWAMLTLTLFVALDVGDLDENMLIDNDLRFVALDESVPKEVSESEFDSEFDVDSVPTILNETEVTVAVIVGPSKEIKRVALFPESAANTPHRDVVALQCHFTPYTVLSIAADPGPSVKPFVPFPAIVTTFRVASAMVRIR